MFQSDGLQDLEVEEIKELISEVDFSSFSEEESVQIMSALSSASEEVKEAFEEEVNIFGDDNFSTYIPNGSNIDVASRRVLVAVGAAMTAIGAATSGGSGSQGGRKVK